MKIQLVLLSILLPVLVFSACATPREAISSTEIPRAKVIIRDLNFIPGQVDITVGDTVQWTNNDQENHSVTSLDFDSGILKPGDTFSFTFKEAGVFQYRSSTHILMTALVVVH